MMTDTKIGVFLCKCGNEIAPLIDLPRLYSTIQPEAYYCEILSFPCLQPGLEKIMSAAAANRLNRIIIAGCEGRTMLKKFETALEPIDILKGQIDMVNLHSHVAAVSDKSPVEKAAKAAKLILASIAEMRVLKATEQKRARIDGPVVVVGNGISSFPAVQKITQAGIKCILSVPEADPEKIIRNLHLSYPGERTHYDRLQTLIKDTLDSKDLTVFETSRLTELVGVTGNYTLTFTLQNGQEETVKAGAIIAALDAELSPPGPEFGYDGCSVLIQSEMEEHITRNGTPKGQVVFWISDYEYGTPEHATLSAKSAWTMAMHMKACSPETNVMIFHNEKMAIPLTGAERAVNRKAQIAWIPYDNAVRPSVQDGYITFCNLRDHVEHELAWDYLVLSPKRGISGEAKTTAKILGLVHRETPFLTGHHAKVRPEMIGREETYLAGSARYPCDLQEALNQGRKAGIRNVEMIEKSQAAQLLVPRIVCVVDPDKCVACGQCQELCDCGGIGIEMASGGLPRVVDPMLCTGGGTCAAACPYGALVLQNNSTDQKEARIGALSRQMEPDEVVAMACVWGGLPAADNAHRRKMTYDPRTHILGIPCVGQIDPAVMAKAFLEGAPGLLLIGCLPEECHHSYGIDHAWNRVNLIKKLFELCGFDRRRIAIAHADMNKPEEFVKTVDSFNALIAALGPIPKTQANMDNLASIYQLCKYNTRIRTLLSVALRRPWEKTYRGDQRHALEFDRDFTAAIEEEFDFAESALNEPAFYRYA